MSAQALLKAQIDYTGFQLATVIEGIPVDRWDDRVSPDAMSVREVLAHLSEAYSAFAKHAAGQSHEWGTYQPTARTPEELLEETMALRRTAAALATEVDVLNELVLASNYIALHDSYHIGQLVTLRLKIEPEWNSYALYQ